MFGRLGTGSYAVLKDETVLESTTLDKSDGLLKVLFCGETEEDFQELLELNNEMKFDKMGAFVYSKEEGTKAFDMPNQVPDSVKKKRLDALMRAQQKISKALQEALEFYLYNQDGFKKWKMDRKIIKNALKSSFSI